MINTSSVSIDEPKFVVDEQKQNLNQVSSIQLDSRVSPNIDVEDVNKTPVKDIGEIDDINISEELNNANVLEMTDEQIQKQRYGSEARLSQRPSTAKENEKRADEAIEIENEQPQITSAIDEKEQMKSQKISGSEYQSRTKSSVLHYSNDREPLIPTIDAQIQKADKII